MRIGLGILYIGNRWGKNGQLSLPGLFSPRKELFHAIYKLMQNKNLFLVFSFLYFIYSDTYWGGVGAENTKLAS
jgi:hypothetical protein